jgi:hypothetical protein
VHLLHVGQRDSGPEAPCKASLEASPEQVQKGLWRLDQATAFRVRPRDMLGTEDEGLSPIVPLGISSRKSGINMIIDR